MDKQQACIDFMRKLEVILCVKYEMVKSNNNDSSLYLVPKGTVDEITYHSKPAKSFRYSDHWNWYSNLNKNPNERYIQCWSVDVPFPRPRDFQNKYKATKPRFAYQVCVIGSDGKYHHVFGEKFDRKTRTWNWIEADPLVVSQKLQLV